MEESEKRRERLKAIRIEASQSGIDHVVGNSAVSHHLSNPLVDSSPIPPLQNNSPAPPRFDFYSDPVSAFSADKRRSKVINQNSQDYFTPPRPMSPKTTPSPVHHVEPNYSPDQRIYGSRSPYHSSGLMTPCTARQAQTSYSKDHSIYQVRGGVYHSSGSTTPIPSHQLQMNYSPDSRMYQARGAAYHSSGPMTPSPARQRMYRGQGPDQSPMEMISPHQGSSGSSSYYLPSNSSGASNNFQSPRFSNMGRGRGRSSGRGRGFGSHESVSAELRPDLYCNNSMVEDPWKLLKPIVWKKVNISMVDSVRSSSFPKSIAVKKARISGGLNESSSSPQPSLAEYLAAAFNEAANDGENDNDKPGM